MSPTTMTSSHHLVGNNNLDVVDDSPLPVPVATSLFVGLNESLLAPCVTPASNSSETFVAYRLAVDVYLVAALCVAGLIGNALSIAVLRRDRDKPNTTNWLLQTLAAVDIVYLMSSFLIQPVKAIYDMAEYDTTVAVADNASTYAAGGGAVAGRRLPWLRAVYPYVEPHAWAVGSIAQTVTVWLVMLVTVDRYVAVCMPMKVRSERDAPTDGVRFGFTNIS